MNNEKEIKDKLRKHHRFHGVNPDILNGIEEYAEWLEALLHSGCYIGEDSNGDEKIVETRKTIEKLEGLKIEIYSNEHTPPHFHVKSPKTNASFDIKNCEILNGNVDKKDYKLIKYWHKKAKDELIKAWDKTRPTNCVVGNYKE